MTLNKKQAKPIVEKTFPQYVGREPYRHWLNYHNLEAVKEKYGEFTVEYNAAYVHILMDYLKHFDMAFVPKDAQEAEEMLIKLGAL